jgi:N6-L-threonylcarbamoyladenine synthase
LASQDVYILAIESSCDDTSAAVLKNDTILSNVVAGQAVHEHYGGVVPELASRAHQQHIVPVVDTALKKAGIAPEQLSAIAFTRGPGLLGSLIVGTSFAKAMALGLHIPLVDVHHMRGHVLAHFINDGTPMPDFPFLCLTVSGGHTQIVRVDSPYDMQVIGSTIDDAAGEAFDKTAKILNLPYPGGPLIDQYAKLGNPKAFQFAKPQIEGYYFSFSGLKTSILYTIQKLEKEEPDFRISRLNDICASVQHTIVNILFDKLIRAAEDLNIREIAIAGGVSANSHLRSELERIGKERKWNTYIPKFEFCTDNAAMIGITGYFHYLKCDFTGQDAAPIARMAFESKQL